MKRVGGLWGTVVSFANLHEAARRASLGKRKRPDVAAFLLNAEAELVSLRRELESGEYRTGPYREFQVHEGKPRLISAAPFRDRVVHHALTQVLEPIFERRFSMDSYACRVGMGTHKALERAKWATASFPYVLKCDIRKYFASIDHRILKSLLEKVVKCRPTLCLAGRIIDGSNQQEEVIYYFPGDDLFSPRERRRGLPLGNQTSQFLANVYLNPLDQYVNRELRPACYVRYVAISYCSASPRASWPECDAQPKASSKDSACSCTSARAVCTAARTESLFSGGGCFRKSRAWRAKT